jgi:hypothetical protein
MASIIYRALDSYPSEAPVVEGWLEVRDVIIQRRGPVSHFKHQRIIVKSVLLATAIMQ